MIQEPIRQSRGTIPPGRDGSMGNLLRALKAAQYHFVTPTPATHKRVVARPSMQLAHNLRDVLGWSLPFAPDTLSAHWMALLTDAGVLTTRGDLFASRLRVSSLGDDLFFHSAFPTTQEDAVFFGPDTYRFASFLQTTLENRNPGGLLVDIGAGSGAGAIVAAKTAKPDRVIMTDLNPKALDLARVNAACADVPCTLLITRGLEAISEPIDLIIANPPFIAGSGQAAYRDGGDMHGAQLSLDWILSGAAALAPGGELIMYTGSAIVDGGADPFRVAISRQLPDGFQLTYRELDPDIFGDQLKAAAYHDVERIAAVGVSIKRTL